MTEFERSECPGAYEIVEAAGIAFHAVRPELSQPGEETSAEIIRRVCTGAP